MVRLDIDMPHDCYSCWVRKNLGCKIANASGWLNSRRDEDCPLGEMSTELHLPVPIGGELWIVVQRKPRNWTWKGALFVRKSNLTYSNLRRVLQDFGKTVFLTEEEAVAKMEQMQEHGNG